MLVFVDESGDTGMKLEQGSSAIFAVTAVVFTDRQVAEVCNEAIKSLRGRLKWRTDHEFKFNKCNQEVRLAFLEAVADFDFRYYTVALNKRFLDGPGFKNKDSHYKYTVKLVFSNMRDLLRDATVYFDTCGGREFVESLERYLRRAMKNPDGPRMIRKVKPEKSHKNNLIQLADMVCSAVARTFKEDKADRLVYRQAIKQREARVQLWPQAPRTGT